MKNNFVELIHKEVSLYSYISRFIKFKKRGNNFVGLCPFHNEKTPSFSVSVDKNLYYCFGCKVAGDIFKFVMDYERVSFVEAQTILSEYSGIPLQKNDSSQNLRDNGHYSINQKFLNFFHQNLLSDQGKQALLYLKSRGLTREIIEIFHLGFAPDSFDYHFLNMNLSQEELNLASNLGLIKKRDTKNNYYSFFRNRIIFPIINFQNKPIGFSGRVLNEQSNQAKYINSEGSSIFDKKKVLFNLNNAKSHITQNRSVIIVEGYMDVIGLFRKGIKNVVACMGTALSSYHIRYLKNLTEEAILIFDSDNAGEKAALSACKLSYLENFTVKVLILKKGEDPFDLSTKLDEKQLIDLIYSENLISSSSFIMQKLLNGIGKNSLPEKKRDALKSVFSFLKQLNRKSDKEMFIKLCSNETDISYHTLLKEFFSENQDFEEKNKVFTEKKTQLVKSPIDDCERKIVFMLIKYPYLFSLHEDISKIDFSDSHSSFLWQFIYTKYLNQEKINYLDFFSSYPLPNHIKKVFNEYFIKDNLNSHTSKENFLIINTFKTLIHRQKLFLIDIKIEQVANNLENFNLLSKYKLERNETLKKIKLLSNLVSQGE